MPPDHKHVFLEWSLVFVQGETAEVSARGEVLRVACMEGASGLRPAMPTWPLCMILSSAKETYETWDIYLLTGIG